MGGGGGGVWGVGNGDEGRAGGLVGGGGGGRVLVALVWVEEVCFLKSRPHLTHRHKFSFLHTTSTIFFIFYCYS